MRCVNSHCHTPSRVSERPTINFTLNTANLAPVYTLKVRLYDQFRIYYYHRHHHDVRL